MKTIENLDSLEKLPEKVKKALLEMMQCFDEKNVKVENMEFFHHKRFAEKFNEICEYFFDNKMDYLRSLKEIWEYCLADYRSSSNEYDSYYYKEIKYSNKLIGYYNKITNNEKFNYDEFASFMNCFYVYFSVYAEPDIFSFVSTEFCLCLQILWKIYSYSKYYDIKLKNMINKKIMWVLNRFNSGWGYNTFCLTDNELDSIENKIGYNEWVDDFNVFYGGVFIDLLPGYYDPDEDAWVDCDASNILPETSIYAMRKIKYMRENKKDNFISKKQNTNQMTKSLAIKSFTSNGNKISKCTTFASKNKTAYNYWANPSCDYLNYDWSLILNDWENKIIYLFNIPAYSIPEEELVMRSDDPSLMDLQIKYNDPAFTDNRSGISFKPYLVDEISY